MVPARPVPLSESGVFPASVAASGDPTGEFGRLGAGEVTGFEHFWEHLGPRWGCTAMRRVMLTATAMAMLVAACSGDNDGSSAATGAATETEDTTATSVAPTLPPPTTAEYIPDTGDGRSFLELELEEKIEVFLADPNSIFASNIAADMGLSGDTRWAPWLLDIMRVGSSTETQLTSARALQDLSGIAATGDPVVDFVEYGIWARSNNFPPGPDYEEWKTKLFATIDPDYLFLLATVDDDETLAAISWGGVRRGGIPELNDPERLTVAQADFMTDDELVLGVVVDGKAVAYPLRFLARHELANDHINGIPISVVYCTLCRTGLVFDRRVDGQVLDFQTSGMLIDSNKIMADIQTDSLWHHLSGTGIAGPHRGLVLEQFPVVTARWSDWVADHPDTETLQTPEPIYFRDSPERPPIAYDYTPGSAYALYYENESVWFPIVEESDTFERKEGVITIQRNGEAVALAQAEVEASDPFVYVLGGEPLVIVPNVGGARVYSADGLDLDHLSAVSIEAEGVTPDNLTLADGSVLPRIVSAQSFWFAWYGQHPDTLTWPEES